MINEKQFYDNKSGGSEAPAYMIEYERWAAEINGFGSGDELTAESEALRKELDSMRGDEAAVREAFLNHLSFGTAGLRGIMGAGTDRMNIFTVMRATQGLANYILKTAGTDRSAAVCCDTRHRSGLFARTTARVLAANGITAHIFGEASPTPCLSYAVRKLGCGAGVNVTASHNPSEYNGYKVYNGEGCQITEAAADAILAEIDSLDFFSGIKLMPYEDALASGLIRVIPDSVMDDYVSDVRSLSLLKGARGNVDRSARIIYTPLNGTGLRPVLRVLNSEGFENITVVDEQRDPDGSFPTCPYPNPEFREALEVGLEYAKKYGADLLIATDPDSDRVSIAVRDAGDPEGFRHLTGNEMAILMLDFVCGMREANGTMPKDPVMIQTIVSTSMTEKIAAAHGAKTIKVLTGFKYIGEQIGLLEKRGEADRFIFGFEESVGFLTGTHARDKDAVNASLIIAEMFSYHRSHGVSLSERLAEIYAEYGFCLDEVKNFVFKGTEGAAKRKTVMAAFRAYTGDFGGLKALQVYDYSKGIDGLPASDVLRYVLEGGSSLIIRPSGTEPKIKAYLSVSAPDRAAASETAEAIKASLAGFFG